MKELQVYPPEQLFYLEMCCRRHIKEMYPDLHRQRQDFGMQGAKSIMMRTSAEQQKE